MWGSSHLAQKHVA